MITIKLTDLERRAVVACVKVVLNQLKSEMEMLEEQDSLSQRQIELRDTLPASIEFYNNFLEKMQGV